MSEKKSVKKTLNFMDGCGNVYRKTCVFDLHDGVLSVYDCSAIQKIPGHVSYGVNNQVFVHSGFEDTRNKTLFQRKFLRSICKNCTKNCGR